MSSALTLPSLLLISVLPLLLAIALMLPPLRRFALWFAPWAALPALVVSLLMVPGVSVELPWLLLGSYLGFDETAGVFLFFTALLWLVAGVYSTGYFSESCSRARFLSWFLLAMAGNLGLIVAQDMVLFYTFFTLMSFASYGLVVFQRTPEALRAGRIYIMLAVLGEVMLFAALVLAARAAGSIEFAVVQGALAEAALRDWIIGLMLLGFGIKVGVVGLHVWLPLAHPVAPAPASAVLSGAMISAGLLGWLRVLPLGELALPGWGGVVLAAGLLAIFYAAFVGLLQRDAKTVLAYSSISTMGVMTAALGLGFIAPENWPLILAAILVYALQHGLAKAALFLGVDMATAAPVSKWQRYLLIAGLLLPALSLAGAPMTSGMIAKYLLHVQAASVTSFWAGWLQVLLPWSSVATCLLMARFLYLVWPRQRAGSVVVVKTRMMWLSWTALFMVVVLSPGFLPFSAAEGLWLPEKLAGALWPVVFAGGLAAVIYWLAKHGKWPFHFRIASGDILLPVERVLWPVLHAMMLRSYRTLFKRRFLLSIYRRVGQRYSGLVFLLEAGENGFRRWAVGASLFLVLVMVFMFLAWQIIF